MIDSTVLWNGLFFGGILSVIMSVLIIVSLRVSAEAWIGDYPPDIREAWGPISAQAKRWKLIFGIPILAAPIVIGVLSLHRLATIQPPLTFWPASLSLFITNTVFNLVDLVLLDWLFFMWIRPRFIVLPGTEGMSGYDDALFHLRAFFIGLVLTMVVVPLIAGGYLLFA